MSDKKSTDVKHIYNEDYFLNQVDGCAEYEYFQGEYDQLFERYRNNLNLLDLKKSHDYLEYGCGRGEVCIYHSLQGGDAVGVDYSEDAINLAKNKSKELKANVNFFISSFSDFNAGQNRFDRIMASEFIEHISIEEGEKFFKLAYDALKPGGKLLIYTYPNTLQRKYGYPIIRLLSLLRGKVLPKIQEDMLSEHYKLYHLNEQNYFCLYKSAKKNKFSKIKVGYDIKYYESSGVIKRKIKKLIFKSPLRHVFGNHLYLLAEK